MNGTGHQLEESIGQLAEMIDGAKRMADSGQMVELDVLAMKIAVLTDALAAQDEGAPGGNGPNPMVTKLQQLMTSLDRLELALRKRNVNLALDLQQADRRLRGLLAYRSDPAGR